jgi:uncharacterized protein YhaN
MACSQARHLNCIMGAMKPLIIILLVATAANAQSIADAARKERARQAQIASVRTFTPESARAFLPAVLLEPPAQPFAAPPPGDPPSQAAPGSAPPAGTATPPTEPAPPPPAPAVPAAPAGADLVKKYTEELAQVRAKVQQLQDQEVALQLEVNTLTNQFFAPKTNEAARREAQSAIGRKQSELTTVRAELEQARRQLQQMEAQGPPPGQ